MSKVPQPCPICGGRCTVVAGFYDGVGVAEDLGARESCRSCMGKGWVEVRNDEGMDCSGVGVGVSVCGSDFVGGGDQLGGAGVHGKGRLKKASREMSLGSNRDGESGVCHVEVSRGMGYGEYLRARYGKGSEEEKRLNELLEGVGAGHLMEGDPEMLGGQEFPSEVGSEQVRGTVEASKQRTMEEPACASTADRSGAAGPQGVPF